MTNEDEFMAQARAYEVRGDFPGYVELILWLKERRCYPTMTDALAAFNTRN